MTEEWSSTVPRLYQKNFCFKNVHFTSEHKGFPDPPKKGKITIMLVAWYIKRDPLKVCYTMLFLDIFKINLWVCSSVGLF